MSHLELLPKLQSPSIPPGGGLDGVIVVVCAADLYLAKACCASIRHSMGNIPITLFSDGSVDTSEMEQVFDAKTLQAREAAPPEMLEIGRGTCLHKLSIFWSSPYERFLMLDADTIVWGDVRVYADFARFDFIRADTLHEPKSIRSESDLEMSVMDSTALRQLHPDLNYLGLPFFIAGVYMSRRGVFTEEGIMELVRMNTFRGSEQGRLNYSCWCAQQLGAQRIGGSGFQVVPADGALLEPLESLPNNFSQPVVFHWMGKKPKLGRKAWLVEHFRREYLRKAGRAQGATLRLFLEEARVILRQHKRSLQKQFFNKNSSPLP